MERCGILERHVIRGSSARAFEKIGYIVFTRRNHCDVLAVKPDMALAYLVECKDYELSQKQQRLAVRELNRNYTCLGTPARTTPPS